MNPQPAIAPIPVVRCMVHLDRLLSALYVEEIGLDQRYPEDVRTAFQRMVAGMIADANAAYVELGLATDTWSVLNPARSIQ